tara:strand:- start:1087 stop:1512 length:426 start_codon:yes stop_codon:yes gene_type:complete
MSKIHQLDIHAIVDIRKALEPALQEIGAEYGLTLTLGRGTYSTENGTGTLKLELATLGENGEAESPAAKDFKAHAELFGLKATDLGRRFVSNGSEFEISGLKPRNRKYPIIATKVSDGRGYKFSEEGMSARLALYAGEVQA